MNKGFCKYYISRYSQILDPLPLNPNQAGVSESLKRRGGGQMAHRWKSVILAIFLQSKHKKSYQVTVGTQELPPTGSMTSHGPSLDLTGSFKRTLWYSSLCKAVFSFSKKIHSLNLLNIMEHVYGHCCPSPRFREPSWTFMDPQMDPKIDPARLILGDPCW